MQQDEENGAMQVTVNEDYLIQNIKLLSAESTQQISEIQDRTEKLTEESKSLQKQITELKEENRKDIVVKIRERQIENEVISTLRTEALEQFSTQKKSGIFAKLFRSSQIELEKEQFIVAFVQQHLPENLLIEFKKYNDKEIQNLMCHKRRHLS